jgi:hypothetical protein
MGAVIIFIVPIMIFIYLLVGSVYVGIIYRQDVIMSKTAVSGQHQDSKFELISMLVFAAISWPFIMYNRIMDARDAQREASHRHVLDEERS